MTYKQLNGYEFKYLAQLMHETKTSFANINLDSIDIIGKGTIDIQNKNIYGKPTLKEKLTGNYHSEIIGSNICECYNMIVLLNPYKKITGRENKGIVTLFSDKHYSINMHQTKHDEEVLMFEGKIYGPNHSPNISYEFKPDTVVFSLKSSDISDILAVEETKC